MSVMPTRALKDGKILLTPQSALQTRTMIVFLFVERPLHMMYVPMQHVAFQSFSSSTYLIDNK